MRDVTPFPLLLRCLAATLSPPPAVLPTVLAAVLAAVSQVQPQKSFPQAEHPRFRIAAALFCTFSRILPQSC